MADAKTEERAPLLNATIQSRESPGSIPQRIGREYSAVGTDELPPPYTPTSQGGIPMINCKVCQALVNIEGRDHQHVIKCSVCHEATPIKAAPHGKKYVRCPCNCLLICKTTSSRILCPRPNCKRVISLGGIPVATSLTPDVSRCVCAYCDHTFLFNNVNQSLALARCPHCSRVSSVGSAYKKKRAIIYACLAVLFLAAGIGVTVGTYELSRKRHGYYALWIGAFITSLVLFARSIYFCTIRVSSLHQGA